MTSYKRMRRIEAYILHVSFVFFILIILGLIYDNAIISVGASIGAGSYLKSLSMPRFILHDLLTPTLLLNGFALVSIIIE